jgi:hypothetical protein
MNALFFVTNFKIWRAFPADPLEEVSAGKARLFLVRVVEDCNWRYIPVHGRNLLPMNRFRVILPSHASAWAKINGRQAVQRSKNPDM